MNSRNLQRKVTQVREKERRYEKRQRGMKRKKERNLKKIQVINMLNEREADSKKKISGNIIE